MNTSGEPRGTLILGLISITISLSLFAGCLEELESPPLPPLAEDQRFDGSMYEPPSSPNGSASGGPYGSYGSGASGAGPYESLDTEEE